MDSNTVHLFKRSLPFTRHAPKLFNFQEHLLKPTASLLLYEPIQFSFILQSEFP